MMTAMLCRLMSLALGLAACTTTATKGGTTAGTAAGDAGPRFTAESTASDVVAWTEVRGDAPAPPPPATALDDARWRWEAYLAAEAGTLGFALDAAGAGTPGRPLGPEQTQTIDAVVPFVRGGQLTVLHTRRLVRASELRTPGHVGCNKYRDMTPTPSPTPTAAPCAPMRMPGTVTRRVYTADLALVLDYDAHGAFLGERRFLAHAVPGPAPVTGPGEPGY